MDSCLVIRIVVYILRRMCIYLRCICCISLLLANSPAVVAADGPGLPPDVVVTQNAQDKPLPPEEALKRMTVPEGFNVSLFAGEPNVMQPIAFDFDDRGRLWVVECFSYPDWKNQNRDRVLIFTDKDGDGRFDERKVFFDKGHRLSGITLGFGGVWVTSSPNLLFIPDENGDDVPDGAPVVHLDGFTLKAGHNMVNGLAWGPDGWLYGRHGITTSSLAGRPGTPDKERIQLNCSIWRYHPIRHIFEVVVNGTTNPWGLDWDENGQAFFSNNVIGHLWHVSPGAHYKRMFGEDFNPYLYGLMDSCSDHRHFAGTDWTKSRSGKEHSELGGGHSHSGAMIYQGDNWPDEYRHRIMMANIHGNRLLFDELERSGSGYVGRHGKSFLMANDPWFRGVMIAYGPDGGVFVSDWNDLGECHDNDGSYRASGRIYKITYGKTKPVEKDLDLAKLSDSELVRLQLEKNDWYVRHARRILEERAAAGKLSAGTQEQLRNILSQNREVPKQLRAIWALHVTGGLNEADLLKLAGHESEYVRWWAIQLLVESKQPSSAALEKFATLAREDRSPMVRLSLASALQRVPLQQRWNIVEGLVLHEEDAKDQNLPLMIWYATEPLIPGNATSAIRLAGKCKIPLVREYISRRVAAK